MSKLTNNTTDLQAILDEVSSYKEIIETQDDLIAQISTVLESKSVPSLPVLSNPATAENIDSGFEAIDGMGAVIMGTSEKKSIIIGTITAGGSKSLTITQAIGKDNIVIYMKNTSAVSGFARTIIASYIDSVGYSNNINGRDISKGAANWDKVTGTMSGVSWDFHSCSYEFIAW